MGEHDEFSMADVSANRRIGFWWLQRAAQSVAVDAALAQMMGQGDEATSIPLNELLGLVQSADSALLSQAIASAFAGELPAAYEIRLHSGASLMMKLGLVASAGEPPLVVACCQAMPAHGQTPQDSTRDALTGLYSRQYFDLMLEREWRISMRERHALSLLFIDVAPDAEAGIQEKLLIRMGELLPAGVFRPADVAARYAQSRLALLLPRTEAEGAQQVAERLFAGLAADPDMQTSAPAGKLVVNMGLGCLTASATALGQDVLLARSEAAAHMARLHGGNRIEVWQPHFPEIPPAWE